MSTHDLSLVLSGATALGFFVIALFFLRFWRQTRDRLFACFAFAFVILAVERLVLLTNPEPSHQPQVYCTRLVAFLVIAGAIWDRNRQRR